jgi:tetratricopeptide (TPR) repeat protein
MGLGRLVLPWLVGAWLVLPSTALGQDRLARTHYEAGSAYYQQGRYEEALREFEEAYRLSSEGRRAVLHYNIGLAHERLGHLTDAIDALRRYLEGSPNADDAEIVTERMRTLQARLDSTGIVLTVSEEGAGVVVDGEARGTTPLTEPVRVTPGAHEVRVEKDGFHAVTIHVTVPAGERVTVRANLVPAAEPAPAADVQAPIDTRRREPGGGGAGPLPWILFGVGGASAIGGVLFGANALARRDEANDAAGRERGDYDSAREAAKRSALLADVAFGVTVAAVVTGVILMVTSGGGGDDDVARNEGTIVAPVAFDGGGGLAIAGSL